MERQKVRIKNSDNDNRIEYFQLKYDEYVLKILFIFGIKRKKS
jgi:hypothetical protein